MDRRLLDLDMKTSIRAIADLAMPRTCLVCGTELLLQESNICGCCLSDLPRTHFSRLSHNPMADAFNARIEESRCRRKPGGPDEGAERYCYATALFHYKEDSPYTALTQALKYHRDFSAGKRMAGMLASELAGSKLFADADLIIPVPLHWRRKLKRGYNQAEVIAKEVSRIMGIPVGRGLLMRRRNTTSQAKLETEAKRDNVRGAFCAAEPSRFPQTRHILLIDDVFTSGSTMEDCHRALRESLGFGVRISATTLAFAGQAESAAE